MLSNINFVYFTILTFLFFMTFTKCDDSSSSCGEENPTNRNDCLKASTSNKLCCYDHSKKQCEVIKYSELKELDENIDCGVVNNNVGEYEFSIYHPYFSSQYNRDYQTCGSKKPKKAKDCTKYSQLTNSCCFFDINGEKGCYSIGKKFSGDKKGSWKREEDEIEVKFECKGNFLNIIINQLIGVFIFSYLIF